MPGIKFAAFSNTFLLDNKDGGKPTLKFVGPTDGLVRKKRPHRKSRKGCIACKRRKVKCDEKQPCGNCIKRKDACTHSRPGSNSTEDEDECPLGSPTKRGRLSRELSPILPVDESSTPVNMLHLELFHHFAQSTARTLCFEEVWPLLLPLAVHHDYLMNAMLSIAAAHLSSICPYDDRYRCASLSSLSQSIENYRHQLSLPITSDNADALMGTAILIYYISWMSLEFLEDQHINVDSPAAASYSGLDLSNDQLFLLSAGLRQIYMMAHPHFHSPQSVFSASTIFMPCSILDDVCIERGIDKSKTIKPFLALFADPRFTPAPCSTTTAGLTPDGSTSVSPYLQPSTPTTTTTTAASFTTTATATDTTSSFFSIYPWDTHAYTNPSEIEPPLSPSISNCFTFVLFPELPRPLLLSSCDPEIVADLAAGYHLSTAVERIVDRLAEIIEYAKIVGGESRDGQGDALLLEGTATVVPQRQDLERYVLSFPVVCFGPFLPLVLGADSRALVVLWYFYRAARVLLMLDDEEVVRGEVVVAKDYESGAGGSSSGRGWCYNRRCIVMEETLGEELRARGLDPVALLEEYAERDDGGDRAMPCWPQLGRELYV